MTQTCSLSSLCRYHLVKLLEKFGHVKQFDFLFHKSGPLEGQPRGYCFVNFNTREVGAGVELAGGVWMIRVEL